MLDIIYEIMKTVNWEEFKYLLNMKPWICEIVNQDLVNWEDIVKN